jgi:hypothetical protein
MNPAFTSASNPATAPKTTRADVLRGGVLIDVSATARGASIRWPLALMCAVSGYDTEGSRRSRLQSITPELTQLLGTLSMPDYRRGCLSVC